MFAPSLNLDLEKIKETESGEAKSERKVARKGARTSRTRKPAAADKK